MTSLREYAMSVSSGYSSDVRLQLIVGERAFEVEQALCGTCLLAEPVDYPPCEGELVMHVDGRRRAWPVVLRDGISAQSKLVVFG
jgi:hypothetical protein